MRLGSTVAIFALALGACVACSPTTQTPHTTASASLEERTVALVRPTEDGPRAYCSGVWVAADEVLTANHCVAARDLGERVAYVTRGDLDARSSDEVEAIRFGTLAARDEAHDLALLSVKLPPKHAVAGVGAPTVGQAVGTMGHPLGMWWSYSEGTISAVRMVALGEDADDLWWVQSTAPISPGNSGGGLFDTDGNLVGLCHAYMPRGENVNLYIHPQYIAAFLSASRNAPSPDKGL